MPRLSLTHVLNMTRVFIWDSKPQKSVQCAKEKGSTSVSFPWFEFLGCAQWRLFERGIEAHHQGLTKSTSNISATLRLAQLHILLLQVDEFTGKLWEIYETIKSEGGPVQVKCWSSLCFLDLMQDMNDLLFRGETLKGKDISLWTKGRSQKNGKLWELSQVGDPPPPPVWEPHVCERKKDGLFCILGH